MVKYNTNEIKDKKIKAENGNIGYYSTWQPTAKGIKIWLEDENKCTVGYIMLSDIKDFVI